MKYELTRTECPKCGRLKQQAKPLCWRCHRDVEHRYKPMAPPCTRCRRPVRTKEALCWKCRQDAEWERLQRPRRLRRAERRRAFLLLRLGGLTYEQIGRQTGVSRQYAQEMCRPDRPTMVFIRARAAGRCEDCREVPRRGHFHHLTRNGLKPEQYQALENLRYLCTSCHKIADWAIGEGSSHALTSSPIAQRAR